MQELAHATEGRLIGLCLPGPLSPLPNTSAFCGCAVDGNRRTRSEAVGHVSGVRFLTPGMAVSQSPLLPPGGKQIFVSKQPPLSSCLRPSYSATVLKTDARSPSFSCAANLPLCRRLQRAAIPPAEKPCAVFVTVLGRGRRRFGFWPFSLDLCSSRLPESSRRLCSPLPGSPSAAGRHLARC